MDRMPFNITEEDAKKLIYDRLMNMNEYDLESILQHLYGHIYAYDFRIVKEYETPDEYGLPVQYRESGPLKVD